jgi:hypothetical protein
MAISLLTYRLIAILCRRLLQVPKDFQWTTFEYMDPNAELIPTEWSYLRQNRGNNSNGNCVQIPKTFSIDAKPYASASPSATGSSSSATATAVPVAAADAAVDASTTTESKSEPMEETKTKTSSQSRLIGLEMKFTLPPGTYATMMLREITKQGTDTEFQAQLTASTAGGRGINSNRGPAAVAAEGTSSSSSTDIGADNSDSNVLSAGSPDGEDASPAKKRKM